MSDKHLHYLEAQEARALHRMRRARDQGDYVQSIAASLEADRCRCRIRDLLAVVGPQPQCSQTKREGGNASGC